MNGILNASSRLVVALVALSVLTVAVAAGLSATGNEGISRLYINNLTELRMVELMMLTLEPMVRSAVADFFWLSAALVLVPYVVVHVLARRHNRLWFVLLPILFVGNWAAGGQIALTKALVGFSSDTAFEAVYPRSAGRGHPDIAPVVDASRVRDLLAASGFEGGWADMASRVVLVLIQMTWLVLAFSLIVLLVVPLWELGRGIWWKRFHRHAPPPPLRARPVDAARAE